jgi:uncharacterized protein (DUF1697 family)
MHAFISLLRGINVSNQKSIRMPELKALYEAMGFINVTTYVQSGNVVFDCADSDAEKIGAAIEMEIENHFGFNVPVIMRDLNDLQRIVDGNPFVQPRNEDPSKLHVTFLAVSPSTELTGSLKIPPGIVDECVLSGKEIYLLCPNGYGKTKLSNGFFERKLKVQATTRNWKTVVTLYDIIHSRYR